MAKCVKCGNSGVFLKVDSFSLCLDCEEKYHTESESALLNVKRHATELNKENRSLSRKVRELQDEIDRLKGLLAENNIVDSSSPVKKAEPSHAFESSVTASAFTYLAPAAFKKKALRKGFVAFDFETTGLRAGRDSIIEIGAIIIENGHEVDRFSSFVNPLCHIPDTASKINNIYDYMVSGAPTIQKLLPKFLSFIGDRPLIAHNADFDISFLEAAMNSAKLYANISYGDTLRMARKKWPSLPNHKLGTISDFLGITINNQHRAIGDCEALVKIVDNLLV